MEKEAVNYHTQGIFFEEIARKKWKHNSNTNGFTENEENALKYVRQLKKIKARMIDAIKEKNLEIQEANAENFKLRVVRNELWEMKRCADSSITSIKNNLNKPKT